MKQLRLDIFPKPQEQKRIHYSELPIDQKINLKANSAGFSELWIKSCLCWKKKYEGFIYRGDKHDQLSEKWFWHHKVNNKHRITSKGRLDLI
jgi:hypothetical protein